MKSRIIGALALFGATALGLCLLTWISGTTATVTGEQPIAIAGTAAAPGAAASATVILLGAFALTAVRKSGALVVLAVVSVVAILGGVTVALAAARPDAHLLREVTGSGELVGDASVSPVVYLCVAVFVAASVVSIYGLVRVGAWDNARTRFDAAAPTASDPRTQAMDDWDALSAGDDPSGGFGENG